MFCFHGLVHSSTNNIAIWRVMWKQLSFQHPIKEQIIEAKWFVLIIMRSSWYLAGLSKALLSMRMPKNWTTIPQGFETSEDLKINRLCWHCHGLLVSFTYRPTSLGLYWLLYAWFEFRLQRVPVQSSSKFQHSGAETIKNVYTLSFSHLVIRCQIRLLINSSLSYTCICIIVKNQVGRCNQSDSRIWLKIAFQLKSQPSTNAVW